MQRCKICHRNNNKQGFNTARVKICVHCTKAINEYSEPAKASYQEIGKLLRKGINSRLLRIIENPASTPLEIANAIRDLENFDDTYQKALPSWINKLVSDSKNQRKMIKIIRAERRKLLLLNKKHKGWGYPKTWSKKTKEIRKDDHYTCTQCGKTDVELHVHHIIYVSNYGTHNKNNLVTLCRQCHEKEHGRVFDFGENLENTDIPPQEVEAPQKEVLNIGKLSKPFSRKEIVEPEPITPEKHPSPDRPESPEDGKIQEELPTKPPSPLLKLVNLFITLLVISFIAISFVAISLIIVLLFI